jgi:hypothetical protein
MRALILLLLISGCIINMTPPLKPAAPVTKVLPAPVWPNQCVADWYAKTDVPPCAKSWVEAITQQQDKIERKRDGAKQSTRTTQ